ncbi:RteC domain-containing protein [Sphingobacterium thalpophilum]|uniref:RteC domain-containing protein n=1 Tax=Sphingobacterium thalpophilum TaxID=259 RepID=UPI003D95CB47
MNQFLIDLQQNMEVSMHAISKESEHDLELANRNKDCLNKTMELLNDFVRKYEFQSIEDEIRFFKEQRPLFYAEYIFWNEVFFLESNFPVGKKWQIRFLKKELKRINNFFERHKELYKYYKQQLKLHDGQLFVRYPDEKLLSVEENPELDSKISTAYSSLFAKFIAFEKLAAKIQNSIVNLKNGEGEKRGQEQTHRLRWTGTKAQLIELVYALASSGVINHGKIHVKQLFLILSEFLHTEVTHYYPYFQRMRIKKKDRAQFMSYLSECLLRRMDESDENPRFS